MLELGVGADLVRAVGWVFIVFVLACLAGIAWLATKGWPQAGVALLVLLAIGYPVVKEGLSQRAVEAAYEIKYQKAKALFEERCKTAGEKIYRTVADVETIALLKIRPQPGPGAGSDPMHPGAALFSEGGHDDYIASFLRYEKVPQESTQRGQLSDKPTSLPGYRVVEVVEDMDGLRYAYTKFYDAANPSIAEYDPIPKIRKSASPAAKARYAVTYEDLMEPEDRRYWIAGTVLKVIDMQTKEVIAEHKRYLFDTGLGSTNGGRNPWGWAESYVPSCPASKGSIGQATRNFVDQILKPIKGE
jgi:hypothetical protein